MKKFTALILALLMSFSFAASTYADDASTHVVCGAESIMNDSLIKPLGISITSKVDADMSEYIHATANAGEYSNGFLQLTFAPQNFKITDYPFVKVSYRTDSASEVVDTTIRSSTSAESWPDSRPKTVADGTWHEFVSNVNLMTNGAGAPVSGDAITFILKPFGAGNVKLDKEFYFDIRYIACFKSEEEANNFEYTGDKLTMETNVDESTFFFEKADQTLINKYNDEIEALIKEIETSPTTVEVKGTKYYVSSTGSDYADGKSPETAWRTLDKVNSVSLAYGDGVFFKRGDAFRATSQLSTRAGVTYSAYGEGDKPQIIFSVDASSSENWIETEYENVYKYVEPIGYKNNVGNIVFDGGRAWGVMVMPDQNGNRLVNGTVFNGLEYYTDSAVPFTGPDVLVNDLEFYHNLHTEELFVCSKKGNPGDVFESIELGLGGNGMGGIGNGVTIDNLEIIGSGTHGVAFSSPTDRLVIQYCTFKWIGGARQVSGGIDTTTRLGNAVEVFAPSIKNYTVHHNYASQVYDCCWTAQYAQSAVFENITAYKNVSEFCNSGLEYWSYGGSIKNMQLHDNYTRFNGYGFSHQRPTKDGNFFYGSSTVSQKFENNDICNNINLFASTQALLVRATAPNQYNFHDNIYFMEEGKLLGGTSSHPGLGLANFAQIPYTEEAVKAAYMTGFEQGAKFYVSDPEPFGKMYELYKDYVVLKDTNPDISLIFKDVKPEFWGHDVIQTVYYMGLFAGVSADEFAPDSPMTRAMLAVVLNRLSNDKTTKVSEKPYNDVNTDAWFASAVKWALDCEITSAETNTFRPDDDITREELADMLMRYAENECKQLPEFKTVEATDAKDITAGYERAISFCIQSGIITGYGDGSINPKGHATRAEVSTMIVRFVSYLDSAEIDEELVKAHAEKNSKIFMGEELIKKDIMRASGGKTSMAPDGISARFVPQIGVFENNSTLVTFYPDNMLYAEYPYVKIVYKTNSAASNLDVSSRHKGGESWITGSNIPVLTGDGEYHEVFFNLNTMIGGAGPIGADDKSARLILKPFGQKGNITDERYFDVKYIAFSKTELESKSINID